MVSDFGFQVQTKMYYGIGCSRNLPAFLSERGFSNIAFLVDEGVKKNSNYYFEIRNIAEKSVKNLHIQTIRGTEEPDYDYLDEVVGRIRDLGDVDVLVGIGGGSCLDITKAVSVLKTNKGKGIEYRGFDKIQNPGVPVIAMPTTAGTGSEVTINAVFIDKKEKKKLGINGRYMNAAYAILDAEWTLSCPQSVAVSAGMDAMTHALESFICNKANSITKIFSKEAFKLLYHALPSLIDDSGNKEKRQQLLLGSYLAGIALFNSGSGIAGALSYPIGVHFNVPHGIGGGIFIADVGEFNVNKKYQGFAELFDMIKPFSKLSIEEKSESFLLLFRCLTEKLGVPKYLDTWGITKENIRDVVKLMLPLQAAFGQNPVPFSADIDAFEMIKRHTRQ